MPMALAQLHVAGPGIFEGYLNARKAMSADGYFVTGDRASIDRNGLLRVYARTEDLIISGGETSTQLKSKMFCWVFPA